MTQQPGSPQEGYLPPHPAGPPGRPPRRPTPWWVWALSGCGGCTVLAVIAIIVVAAMGVSSVTSLMRDVPVDNASVQRSLGPDLPLYPGSSLDPTTTKAAAAGLRISERMTGQKMLKGAGSMVTQDSPEKVLKFYDQRLKQAGWQSLSLRDTGFQQQRQYRKGSQMVLIQVQQQPGQGTMITLMRIEVPAGGSLPGNIPAPQPAPGSP